MAHAQMHLDEIKDGGLMGGLGRPDVQAMLKKLVRSKKQACSVCYKLFDHGALDWDSTRHKCFKCAPPKAANGALLLDTTPEQRDEFMQEFIETLSLVASTPRMHTVASQFQRVQFGSCLKHIHWQYAQVRKQSEEFRVLLIAALL